MKQGGGIPVYMVAMNYWPLVFLTCGGWTGLVAADRLGAWAGFGLFLGWLYLLPPLLCRLLIGLFGRPVTERATPHQPAFRLWWFLTQLQMPFNRIGLLEELLRLVPGLYSSWLNLWGARVSLLTFWTRDVLISERYLLTVESGVTIASQTGITAHLVDRDAQGQLRLLVAPVVIERAAVMGIRSGLGPGCRLYAGELLPTGRMLPPHCGWRAGRKRRLLGDRG